MNDGSEPLVEELAVILCSFYWYTPWTSSDTVPVLLSLPNVLLHLPVSIMFPLAAYTPPVTLIWMILLYNIWNKFVALFLYQGPLPVFDEVGKYRGCVHVQC